MYVFTLGRVLIYISCNMPPEVTLHKEYESGSIYEYREQAVFVPKGLTEKVESDVESDEEAVRAADAMYRDTPPGVTLFEDNERDARDRGELWASVHDQIDAVQDPLERREVSSGECAKARIPVMIAANGKATIAAYLAACGFTNGEIADALNVGSRTVSQYISDFRKGER